jgi:hypothetical protein
MITALHDDFYLHRFSITQDFFGYEANGVYNGASYELLLDKDMEVVDIDAEDKNDVFDIIVFIRKRINEGIKAGIYNGNKPKHIFRTF